MKTHEWQPIDTCPADAEYVAIWEGRLAYPDAKRDKTGKWHSIPYPHERPSGEPYQLFMACQHEEPSHWMLLPAGPSNEDESWRLIANSQPPVGACVEVWAEGRWLPRAVRTDSGWVYYGGRSGCWHQVYRVQEPEFWRPIVPPEGSEAACENIRIDAEYDDTEIAGVVRAMAGAAQDEREKWALGRAADLLDRLLEGVEPKFVARRPFVYASEGSGFQDQPRRDAMFQMPKEEEDR